MNITKTHDLAQDILEALRVIQDTPGLKAEARTNPQSVMDKLGLSGIARQAVTLGIAPLALAPAGPGTGVPGRILAWL
jgi:hypothetical protein